MSWVSPNTTLPTFWKVPLEVTSPWGQKLDFIPGGPDDLTCFLVKGFRFLSTLRFSSSTKWAIEGTEGYESAEIFFQSFLWEAIVAVPAGTGKSALWCCLSSISSANSVTRVLDMPFTFFFLNLRCSGREGGSERKRERDRERETEREGERGREIVRERGRGLGGLRQLNGDI